MFLSSIFKLCWFLLGMFIGANAEVITAHQVIMSISFETSLQQGRSTTHQFMASLNSHRLSRLMIAMYKNPRGRPPQDYVACCVQVLEGQL